MHNHIFVENRKLPFARNTSVATAPSSLTGAYNTVYAVRYARTSYTPKTLAKITWKEERTYETYK